VNCATPHTGGRFPINRVDDSPPWRGSVTGIGDQTPGAEEEDRFGLGVSIGSRKQLDAIKTFPSPMLDTTLISGGPDLDLPDAFDEDLSEQIGALLKIPPPKGYRQMSWKDGRMSIPSLRARTHLLALTTFTRMAVETSESLRKTFQVPSLGEQRHRNHTALDSDTASPFMDWTSEPIREQKGALIIRAFQAAHHFPLNYQLPPEGPTVNGKLRKTAQAVGKFISQRVIRPHYAKDSGATEAPSM
jgi:hypothetical protein